VLSSANYHCGTECVDHLSIWLNYQIEHHLFSDLPMSTYREIQPVVKALCERHGLPYRQESVFKRFARMTDVVVGRTSGRRLARLP
jgi:fatty acid desaturase